MEDKCLSRDKIDVPPWMDDRDWTESELRDLCYGGCASGCYMPAVTYCEASATMAEHGDAVLSYLEDNLGELPDVPRGESWSGIAVYFLSCAVETWAGGVVCLIDDGGDVYPEEEGD